MIDCVMKGRPALKVLAVDFDDRLLKQHFEILEIAVDRDHLEWADGFCIFKVGVSVMLDEGFKQLFGNTGSRK